MNLTQQTVAGSSSSNGIELKLTLIFLWVEIFFSCWFVTFSRVSHTSLGEVWIWNLGKEEKNATCSLQTVPCSFDKHAVVDIHVLHMKVDRKSSSTNQSEIDEKWCKSCKDLCTRKNSWNILLGKRRHNSKHRYIDSENNSLIYWLHIDPGEIDDRREIFLAWFSLNFFSRFWCMQRFCCFPLHLYRTIFEYNLKFQNWWCWRVRKTAAAIHVLWRHFRNLNFDSRCYRVSDFNSHSATMNQNLYKIFELLLAVEICRILHCKKYRVLQTLV